MLKLHKKSDCPDLPVYVGGQDPKMRCFCEELMWKVTISLGTALEFYWMNRLVIHRDNTVIQFLFNGHWVAELRKHTEQL